MSSPWFQTFEPQTCFDFEVPPSQAQLAQNLWDQEAQQSQDRGRADAIPLLHERCNHERC